MKLARSLVAVGLIVVPLVVPGPPESPAPARGGAITMGHERFSRSVTTIRAGERLAFVNTSHWLHVVVPGHGARQDTQIGLPRLGARNAHLSERGDHWITGVWNVPGTYFLTCQLHPEMTLEVRVLPPASKARFQASGNRRL